MNPQNFSPEVWQRFLLSDKWKLYINNQILPNEAFVYINQIIWQN